MKKEILLGLALSLGLSQAFAQGAWGTHIGNTKYDLQTNGATGNRVSKASDGKMAAVYTQALATSFSDRGTGYVYFDGTNWSSIPTQKLENVRVGWPDHVFLGNGGEFIPTHSATEVVKVSRATKGVGTWSATSPVSDATDGVWPRSVSSGPYVHVIHSSNGTSTVNNVSDPLMYHRSSDNGATWGIQSFFLPGQENLKSVGGDSYSIEAKGNIVTITTSGDMGNDWVMWKSTDNGTTWTFRNILPWSVDGRILANSATSHGVLVASAEQTSVIDANGKLHAWASIVAVSTVDNTDSSCVFLSNSGFAGVVDWMLYWNEDMGLPIVITGLVPDIDNNGRVVLGDETFYNSAASSSVYGFAQVSSPAASIDANGNMYVTYSAPSESVEYPLGSGNWVYPTSSGDSTGPNFRDLYYIVSTDNGTTWSKPVSLARVVDPSVVDVEINGTIYEEECFPMTLRNIASDNMYYVQFQTDFDSGVNLRSQVDVTDNAIMMASVHRDSLLNHASVAGLTDVFLVSDSTSLGMGTPAIPCNDRSVLALDKSTKNDIANEKLVSYPNPTSDILNITVKLDTKSSATVVVKNMFGQTVLETPATQLNNGFNTIQLNLSNLANGLYTYTVTTNGSILSGKVIKE